MRSLASLLLGVYILVATSAVGQKNSDQNSEFNSTVDVSAGNDALFTEVSGILGHEAWADPQWDFYKLVKGSVHDFFFETCAEKNIGIRQVGGFAVASNIRLAIGPMYGEVTGEDGMREMIDAFVSFALVGSTIEVSVLLGGTVAPRGSNGSNAREIGKEYPEELQEFISSIYVALSEHVQEKVASSDS